MEIIGKENRITILNHEKGTREERVSEDPLNEPTAMAANWEPVKVDGLPDVFCGNVASHTWCFQDLITQLLSDPPPSCFPFLVMWETNKEMN
jgi:hypothetical protein